LSAYHSSTFAPLLHIRDNIQRREHIAPSYSSNVSGAILKSREIDPRSVGQPEMKTPTGSVWP
jgi:hypothetical protein